MDNMVSTPVLLVIFNRYDTARKVFLQIRKARPKQLFIAADGPRPEKEGEYDRCQECRALVNEIDWECEVKTLFRESNLGCGRAVSSAITWFFEHVSYGIILEDDCVPQQSFFSFCDVMLKYYAKDERIYEISGDNLQNGVIRGDGSYYFSRYGGIWGWATWARAWRTFDHDLSSLNDFIEQSKIDRIFYDKEQREFWSSLFESGIGKDRVWDYHWLYNIWNNNGICIVPNSNLVVNIGFEGTGTNTMRQPEWYSRLTKNRVDITNIQQPSRMEICGDADDFQFYNSISIKPKLSSRFFSLVKKVIKKVVQ